MIKKLSIALLIIAIIVISDVLSAGSASVTFLVKTANIDSTSRIFITGNQPQLSNWNSGRTALEKIDINQWSISINFTKGTETEYKFTRGSWATEPVDEWDKPFQNFKLLIETDTTVIHEFQYWKDDTQPAKSTITGSLNYHLQMKALGVAPRDIVVWLPPGYDTDSDQRYPVLYMHDGQNIFNASTASFGTEWRIDETADSLIRSGVIQPLIIVGICNTQYRTLEYADTKLGKRYRRFVVRKLKPYIDKQYRTLPDRSHTAVGGSSMGGLVSFMLVWEKDNVFSKAICMSPAFKIEELDYVTTFQNYKEPKKNIQIYIDNGGIELETQLQPGIDEMIAALEQKGYRQNIEYFCVKDENARHFESDWGKRMPWILIQFFKTK
ncbi:MAG: histidine kinase [Candidatus Marinimicrobia bacterium]|nr:histidine kinase [Candidatus Neomarinimicrobiota bacterium]